VIYLCIVSGLLLLAESPFKTTDPERYIRLAGSASFLAFISGYDPNILIKLIERLSAKVVTEGTTQEEGKEERPAEARLPQPKPFDPHAGRWRRRAGFAASEHDRELKPAAPLVDAVRVGPVRVGGEVALDPAEVELQLHVVPVPEVPEHGQV